MFALNGIGYFALVIGLYFLPQLAGRRKMVRLLLMAYTAVTILGWVVLNGDFTDPLGLITKLIEIVLIILLVMEHRAQPA
jgi:ABC-type Na+ efflux pump permease subunit